jgi:pimeloyl-ACP methyl ester carboxylesterase
MKRLYRWFIFAAVYFSLQSVAMAAIKLGTVTEFDVDSVKKTVEVNGFSFTVTDVGEGTPVVLLHGFPDSRHVWRYQIPALLDAGYRVIAPDLRGFGESYRPEGVENYTIDKLAADVVGIMDALGIQKASVAGHDFGAGLAWFTVAHYPDRFNKLVAMSVGVTGNPGWQIIEQREKSWYFDFFNKEGIAEEALSAENFKLFRELIRNQGDPDRFFADMARPGALTAALNWYRANTRGFGKRITEPLFPLINVPVMGVWSSGDHHLLEPQMQESKWNVTGPWRYERVEGAGHWMMLEKPAVINELLLDFLGQ